MASVGDELRHALHVAGSQGLHSLDRHVAVLDALRSTARRELICLADVDVANRATKLMASEVKECGHALKKARSLSKKMMAYLGEVDMSYSAVDHVVRQWCYFLESMISLGESMDSNEHLRKLREQLRSLQTLPASRQVT